MLSATEAGQYQFYYTYLGRDYVRNLTYSVGENLKIKGEWFNEAAIVVGEFYGPNEKVVASADGVTEISITVVKKVTTS